MPFFTELQPKKLKFVSKYKRPQIAKPILRKEYILSSQPLTED